MRREIVSEIRWLAGGAATLEFIAAVNATAPIPNTGKAIAAAVTGIVLAAGAVFDYRAEKRRENSLPQRRNLP